MESKFIFGEAELIYLSQKSFKILLLLKSKLADFMTIGTMTTISAQGLLTISTFCFEKISNEENLKHTSSRKI